MTFIEEIATLLQTAGVGTVGTTIFIAHLPANVCPCLAVIDTGGMTPDEYLPTTEPTFQVFIRSTDYEAGKATLNAVRTALHAKYNGTLAGGSKYLYIKAMAEGGHIGQNEAGQDEFSINFKALLQ